jgi:hypothetical protein
MEAKRAPRLRQGCYLALCMVLRVIDRPITQDFIVNTPTKNSQVVPEFTLQMEH